jgi:hypothetical protein
VLAEEGPHNAADPPFWDAPVSATNIRFVTLNQGAPHPAIS